MQVVTHTNDPRLLWYVAGWVSFCLVAGSIVTHDRRHLGGELRRYWTYLTMPWKLAVFLPAFVFVTFAGRLTDDETWDVISGGGMAALTFLTAPWSVGAACQVLTGRRPVRHLLVATAALLFSSSWFYDGYVLVRDGSYTTRWWSNLMLSPFIYLAGGLLWNLEARTAFGVRLGFARGNWPDRPADRRLLPIVLFSIPLVLLAAFGLLAFVQWRLPWTGQ